MVVIGVAERSFAMSNATDKRAPRIISDRMDELIELCRQFGVSRLEIFGSAMTDEFDPVRSDLDFLVEFSPDQDLGPWFRDFFVLEDELRRLFSRDVDLIFGSGIRNPYFLRNIEKTRTLLYAA
jgi:uncharacterized protein